MSGSLGHADARPTPDDPSVWRRQVAQAFSRASGRYTQLAQAQQQMGAALWEHLPAQAEVVLDLGCGPGHWSRRLAAYFGPHCQVLGLDLAPGMLQVARETEGEGIAWLCADAAELPLAPRQLDLVFSNLAIQWCTDLDALMAELFRVLRPGGRAVINTLGPGTLREVAHVWSTPDTLLSFRSRLEHLASARLAGFTRVRCSETAERFFYPDLTAVMASIRGVGAQATRSAARRTRHDLRRAERRYESLREPAGLPLSYQRLTLVLDKEPASCPSTS